MAEKPMPWFRAYPEAAHDPKFEVAALQTGIHPLIVFGAWWKILCIAGNSPVRGSLYVTAVKRYSNTEVTAMLRIGNDECNALLQSFLDLDMLELDEQGAYRVKNWEKRQYSSDNSTERVKKHREKVREAKKSIGETVLERFTNVSVTPSDTDTDTEIKKNTAHKRAAPPTPPNNDQYQIAMALSKVTGLDFEKNRARLFKEAKTYTMTDLPQIQRDYSPGGLWYCNDWRGKKGEKPKLEQVRETWGNLKPVPVGKPVDSFHPTEVY